MPWGYAAGAIATGVVNSATKKEGGGAGSSSSDKSPWANATPLLVQTLNNAYGQQAALQADPLSARQRAAFDNSYALTDLTRNLAPSLLEQISGQSLGYDPKNPSARPQAFDFTKLFKDGALGRSVQGATQTPTQPAAQPAGTFTNQGDVLNGQNMAGLGGVAGLLGRGGYGSFQYGMEVPKPGTQAYRDMSEYFANGGSDPNNYYGKGVDQSTLARFALGGGGGPGAGGVGGAGGASAGSAAGGPGW